MYPPNALCVSATSVFLDVFMYVCVCVWMLVYIQPLKWMKKREKINNKFYWLWICYTFYCVGKYNWISSLLLLFSIRHFSQWVEIWNIFGGQEFVLFIWKLWEENKSWFIHHKFQIKDHFNKPIQYPKVLEYIPEYSLSLF